MYWLLCETTVRDSSYVPPHFKTHVHNFPARPLASKDKLHVGAENSISLMALICYWLFEFLSRLFTSVCISLHHEDPNLLVLWSWAGRMAKPAVTLHFWSWGANLDTLLPPPSFPQKNIFITIFVIVIWNRNRSRKENFPVNNLQEETKYAVLCSLNILYS
jgi:hypothetical protein